MKPLDGNSLTFEDISQVADGVPIEIAKTAKRKVDRARAYIEKASESSTPIYGVNTGFGYFAKECIERKKLEELQENLVLSHSGGFGSPLSIEETRLLMVLRLNVLLKGYTGVRFELCEALLKLIQHEIYPIIPEYGSVGASGDLAPLAHLALALIGKGDVFFGGKKTPAKLALQKAKIDLVKFKVKEGLGLINGTQAMLAVGGLALSEALMLFQKANRITALTFEGLAASPSSLDLLIHRARGQDGQLRTALAIAKELQGSYLFEIGRVLPRVQDSYSIRCASQVHGPSHDALMHAKKIVEIELNAATDNPLVFEDASKILSGGNFHGQSLAMAFDIASIALAELGNISERRLELLLNPYMSGLPAFLTPHEGLHSGYMVLQYLSASCVNENKLLANPSCTDSIPGNVGIEDHVSMGMTSARKLKKIIKNLKLIQVAEMIAAAQAIDLRKVKKLGKGTKELYRFIRKNIPPLDRDRIVAEDVEKGMEILRSI